MKLHLALLLSAIIPTTAFLPPTAPTPTTALYQFGSLGFDTSGLYTREEQERLKTQSKITHYIRKIRSKVAITPLGPKTLISGFDPADPSASMVLDFLNNEDAKVYFPFEKIVAHVSDGKVAKKRMIGRNARYTGLLDKLEFSEGETLVPSTEQLEGVNSWVVHVAGGNMEELGKVVNAAEGAESVKNVAILLSGAGGMGQKELSEMEEMIKSKATSFGFTVVVVPEWNDVPEAQCAYGIVNVTDVSESGPFVNGETFSREESLRIVTECLAMDGAKGRCVVANAFPDKTSVEGMLIQSMRESGFSRLEEVGMMVMNGSKGCMKMIDDEQKPVDIVPKDTRTPEELKADKEGAALALQARQEMAKREAIALKRKERREELANEWAKREFFRKSVTGELVVNQKQFIEMIWERALFEADITMRLDQGEDVDEQVEREAWKEKQKEKAKAEAAATIKRLQQRVSQEIDSY